MTCHTHFYIYMQLLAALLLACLLLAPASAISPPEDAGLVEGGGGGLVGQLPCATCDIMLQVVRGFCATTPEYWSAYCHINSMTLVDVCHFLHERLGRIAGKDGFVCDRIEELIARPGVSVCRDPQIQCSGDPG